jgi:hypothetical protein
MRAFGPVAIVTLALTLSACSKKEEAPAAAASSDAAAAASTAAAPTEPAAGDYAVFDASGKALGTTTINADGTYRIWKVKDGKTCFDPSGKDPEECYTSSAPAADGSFTATDTKGAVLTVRPVKK